MPVSKNRRKNGKKTEKRKSPHALVLSTPHQPKPKTLTFTNPDDLYEYFCSKGYRRSTPQDELNSLRLEFEALDIRKQKYGFAEDSYDLARWLVYKECLACLESENPTAYEYDEGAIKKAGFILLNEKGEPDTNNMHDRLFWSFIPKSEQRIIDVLWDGIGDWKG